MPSEFKVVLRELKDGTRDLSEFLFEFRIGNDFLGFIDYELHGSGKVRIHSTVTQGLVNYWKTFDVPSSKIIELVDVLILNELWMLFPHRTDGIPSEKPVEIVARYSNELWTWDFWHDDILQRKQYREIQDYIMYQVQDLTHGKVLKI